MIGIADTTGVDGVRIIPLDFRHFLFQPRTATADDGTGAANCATTEEHKPYSHLQLSCHPPLTMFYVRLCFSIGFLLAACRFIRPGSAPPSWTKEMIDRLYPLANTSPKPYPVSEMSMVDAEHILLH